MFFLDNVLDKDEITENLIYFVNYWEYFCRTIENPKMCYFSKHKIFTGLSLQ